MSRTRQIDVGTAYPETNDGSEKPAIDCGNATNGYDSTSKSGEEGYKNSEPHLIEPATDKPCNDTEAPTEDITDEPIEETTAVPSSYHTDRPTNTSSAENTETPQMTTPSEEPCKTQAVPTQTPTEEVSTQPPTEEVTTQPPTGEVSTQPPTEEVSTQPPTTQTPTTFPPTTQLPTTQPQTPTTIPPTTQPPTTQPAPSPCTNQGTNGIGVESKVRYNNVAINSTTTDLRNAQSWHSCRDSCWADIKCAAFSFDRTSSSSVCELTTSTTGRTTGLNNWQAGNIATYRALL